MPLDDEIRYRLLRRLEADPDVSQRELAKELGISLGKINYCLKALTAKGLVKAANFRNSKQKQAYLYKLTPQGISEKADLTVRFLRIKEQERRDLLREIEVLREEVRRAGIAEGAEETP